MARKSRRVSKGASANVPLRNKVEIAWKNLVIFLILFIFSFILYSVSASDFFLNLFALLSIIFGFVSFALVIVLVVFLILKSGKK